ncbi:A disintegrin and metalloproteinase with thrombospondin motifs 5-like [Aphidius gifuensis]|uniref:A disintegrin and metalloproteinase with thrombospondin motifs 5-like n=1 Tax=Aphidius gifuensis TaxID=684658 RepID=UPI001CDCE277|nr:A disintegrin and metalloproteinase with thrombospondin motifs 5-like [Aphidius gifuensis]
MCIVGGGWVLSSMTFSNQYGYDDIINAAHEMGHSFGLEHDEDYGCMEGTGIMAASKPADRIAAPWSQCSLDKFDELFHGSNYTCLYNKPENKGTPIPRYLPKDVAYAEDKLQNEDNE